jgi:hypothetical protein
VQVVSVLSEGQLLKVYEDPAVELTNFELANNLYVSPQHLSRPKPISPDQCCERLPAQLALSSMQFSSDWKVSS